MRPDLITVPRPVRKVPHQPILIVEDDPTLAGLLRLLLESEGLTVETASDEEEVLKRIDRNRPAVVLLDLILPHSTGESVAAAVTRRIGAVPIIVISASDEIEQRALRARAAARFRKPLDINDLIDTVWQLLESNPGVDTGQ